MGTSVAPAWAERRLLAFRELLRVVSLSEGFTLVPVEISGPDVAHALAAWLTTEGHPSHVVAPQSDAEWLDLVASLFKLTTGAQDVVVFVGPRELSPGAVAGLRLVNQRRDTLARHIGRPLLWCGPHEFLDATWDIAPDFWSIRAMTQTVEGVMPLPPEPTLPPSHWVSDGVDRLREIWNDARRRGDAQSMQRVALNLATALMDEQAYEEAEALLDEAERTSDAVIDTPVRRSLRLLRVQTHVLRGTFDEARHQLEAVPDSPVDDAVAGEHALVVGNVELASDEKRAHELYLEAEAAFLRARDRRNEGVARWSVANALVGQEVLEEAAASFDLALALFREIADARHEARALSSLGRVHAALHDMRTANAYFDDALAITREIGDHHGEATVLRRLARIYVTIGDPEKAIEDCERALAIARILRDRRGEGKSLTVLGAAHSALGDRARASQLLEAALAIADELGDARMRTGIERALRSLPPPPSM